jgi:hypothetical protein
MGGQFVHNKTNNFHSLFINYKEKLISIERKVVVIVAVVTV